MKDAVIVLAAYGAEGAAKEIYAVFEKIIREQFPTAEIRWCFTDENRRAKAQHKDVVSPANVLKSLMDEGCERVVLQSLHIVPGLEYEKLKAAVKAASLQVVVGSPLLTSEIDCHRAFDVLAGSIADPAERVTVFVGHGTAHSAAGAMYMQFESCLKGRYAANVHLSLLEGVPSWETACEAIRSSGLKKVRFVPLMFVAEQHMNYDVMGCHREAWKADLAGFDIEVQKEGLGNNPQISTIYCDHIREALKRL